MCIYTYKNKHSCVARNMNIDMAGRVDGVVYTYLVVDRTEYATRQGRGRATVQPACVLYRAQGGRSAKGV